MLNYEALEKAKAKLDSELAELQKKDAGFKDDPEAKALYERLIFQTRSYVGNVQTVRK